MALRMIQHYLLPGAFSRATEHCLISTVRTFSATVRSALLTELSLHCSNCSKNSQRTLEASSGTCKWGTRRGWGTHTTIHITGLQGIYTLSAHSIQNMLQALKDTYSNMWPCSLVQTHLLHTLSQALSGMAMASARKAATGTEPPPTTRHTGQHP